MPRKKPPEERGNEPATLSRRTLLKGIGVAGIVGLASESTGAEPNARQGTLPFPGKIGLTDEDSKPFFPPKPKPPQGAPNVIVILFDDVGFADLGCYGGDIRTPVLDGIAANGLRYTNFRTAAVCSATRAALLTGLNPHSAGIGRLADVDRGYPGYRGDLTHDAATLAELLRSEGYGTYHVGKWHLNNAATSTNVGPMDNWPAQRGFDRTYWFHSHSSDYFRPPEMFDGNSPVELGSSADYYITDDLTDHAIDYIRTHRAVAPNRPFFAYIAYNGAHSPLQARAADRELYRGHFDKGWDKVREECLARQKAAGIVPSETELPPRNPGVPAWDSLGADERKLYARYMEVYAGVVHRLDWNVGRVLEALSASGILDNTLLLITSDNGASAEGSSTGTPNMLAGLTQAIPTREALKYYDVMGERDTMPHYPTGWAMASNTPFRMYKQTTYLGGTSDPLIVHWPNGIKSRGGAIRTQYTHVIDVYPTIVDAVGIEPLKTYQGRSLKPVEGTSFRRTFDAPSAPSRRTEQHFEMNGRRAMYANGWHMVTTHRPGTPFSSDVWELYHSAIDFNESRDLAKVHPEIVKELERKWLAAAKRYAVLPLDDWPQGMRTWAERWKYAPSSHVEIIPPAPRILHAAAPGLLGRDHTISVELERTGDEDGVLVAFGNMFTGFVLYVRSGLLIYETSARPFATRIQSASAMPMGACTVKYVQKMTRRPFEGAGALFIDDRQVGTTNSTLFGAIYQGLEIGRNGACPVSLGYEAPFPFKGKIFKVSIDYDTAPWTPDELKSMLERRQYRA